MLETISSFPVALASIFSLIGLAEMGDKSQLVCIALAVRYRAAPVLMGTIAAFALLNLAAVLIGAAACSYSSFPSIRRVFVYFIWNLSITEPLVVNGLNGLNGFRFN